MKKVLFTRVVMPIQPGEHRVVPDAMAERLVKGGKVRIVPSVFDKAVGQGGPRRPKRQTHSA